MPSQNSSSPGASQASSVVLTVAELDQLTRGAFTSPTSGERAQRVREWLASEPSAELMQAVFKELGARDKGAAKPLREKLEELRRAKGQEAMAAEWAAKASALLTAPRFHIADALAWQRDAAKSGAPLSKQPLASLKTELAERIKGIEDLQHQVLVQREAAVLMAQRIEVLSTKSWHDAQQACLPLQADVLHWKERAQALTADANWSSVDAKFAPLLDASQSQLWVVWEAFSAAVASAQAAASDPAAPLPPVPVWANELRAQRPAAASAAVKPGKPAIDPEVLAELRTKAGAHVSEALGKLEHEMAEGHGKASAAAAAAVRQALKDHGKHLDAALEANAHAAIAAAGELEGWQRWRADQLRQELVKQAEALLKPAAKPALAAPVDVPPHQEVAEPETAKPEAVDNAAAPPQGKGVAGTPANISSAAKTTLNGRKLQETLRNLREQWKQVDQGGVPNHALWKRFDEACNLAYQSVELWLEKVKAQEAAHRAQRLALIEEVKAWTVKNTLRTEPHEWKAFSRAAQQFVDRWRDGGHVGEKTFEQLQPVWKAVIHEAYAPLEAAQKHSRELRQTLIEQATALGAEPNLRIDSVRNLQQRWQAEAQSVPLERKLEQKLWEAFRKPIDEAFDRKTQEREKADAALGARDRAVLDAAKALDAASASGDAQAIHAAMTALQAALQGQQEAAAVVAQAAAGSQELAGAVPASAAVSVVPEAVVAAPQDGDEMAAPVQEDAALDVLAPEPAAAPVVPVLPAKKVIAVRGDDRPGMRKTEPLTQGRGAKPGAGKGGPPRGADTRAGDNRFVARESERGRPAGQDRFADRAAPGERREFPSAPRLGDSAFRAQREALEHAQLALKKLAQQAQGEVLANLTTAWELRDEQQLPTLQALGSRVNVAARSAWAQALRSGPAKESGTALLRLEMAAELPSPAAQLDARRALQLQLLTRRNDPPPAQTWPQDVASVLAQAHEAEAARRLQNVLKVLLRKASAS
ncbi:MAG: DUF349 domain-containing protein [Burkholderiaceae bacterium]